MPRHPHPARSTDALERRVFDTLAARVSRHEGTLHHLNVGDTWRAPPPAARVGAVGEAERPGLHQYAPPQGEPALLAAIERHLAARAEAAGRPKVARRALLVTAGATSGLSVAAQALLDQGDEVILPSPFWPLIRGLLASRGAVPVEVPAFTRLDEPGFDLEAELERRVGPRTAAVYVNSPNNPTGRVLSGDHLAAVARVARRHDLWVLADEVYERTWHEQAPPPAPWLRDDLAARTVSVHSLSKSHGLAGARVGWAHGPEDAMARLRAVHVHQVYCAPRPSQHAALAALEQGDEWLAETLRLAGDAGRKAAGVLGLPWPGAGTFLFWDATPWIDGGDVLPFLERCLDAGVLLTPGTACGRDFATWVRMCFTCVPPDELADAVTRLAGVLGSR
jgi:N-succinyldiaminopimelate aminotransferase